ncbi:MAG: hypothetical protein EB127_30840 [Alphaproteobacteria bacterium]|nr:hypothetical protein [Alphaproteobacteria bacterium]
MNKVLKKAVKAHKEKVRQPVTVEFDERHIPVIARALEIFMRMRSGQITMALDECYADKQTKMLKNKNYDHFNDNKDIEALIRKIYFKDLGSPNAAWGVGQYGFGGEEAYMIWKTLRQYMAYKRNDGYAGTGRDFDTTWGSYSDVPNPVVQGFSTRKFFRVPNNIRTKMYELFCDKKYQECYGLIDKKWKTLPKGDKYELAINEENSYLGVWVTAPRKKKEGW